MTLSSIKSSFYQGLPFHQRTISFSVSSIFRWNADQILAHKWKIKIRMLHRLQEHQHQQLLQQMCRKMMLIQMVSCKSPFSSLPSYSTTHSFSFSSCSASLSLSLKILLLYASEFHFSWIPQPQKIRLSRTAFSRFSDEPISRYCCCWQVISVWLASVGEQRTQQQQHPQHHRSTTMPSAGLPLPAVQANKDGSVTIQYVPTQSGVHELNLSYNETPVEGQHQYQQHHHQHNVHGDAKTAGIMISLRSPWSYSWVSYVCWG